MKPLFLAACLAAPLAAEAQTVTAADPQTVVAALQSMGYRAELFADSRGDPAVSSGIEGLNYTIWFYGCRNNTDCDALDFSSGFEVSAKVQPATINQWNYDKLVGRAFTNADGDPYLDFYVVTDGGLSAETFESIVNRWGSALREYADHVGY